MGDNLVRIVRNFSDIRVAVVGDIMIDCYSYGRIHRLNPESAAPLITIDDSQEDYRLGGAANAALNARKLGAKVDLYGSIGDDESGFRISEMCGLHGIKLIKSLEGKTIKKQRFIERNPEKSNFHYMMRADFGEEDLKPLSNKESGLLIWEFMKNYSGYNGVILSDYNKRVLRGALGEEVIGVCNERGIPTVVDPKPGNDFIKFRKATVIRPNIHEARKIVGRDKLSYKELSKLLKEKMETKYAVISCGAEGLAVYGSCYVQLPSKALKVLDVSGAGDTIASSLLLSLIIEDDIIKAGKIANYSAGIVVEKQGTSYASQDELIDRIKRDFVIQ